LFKKIFYFIADGPPVFRFVLPALPFLIVIIIISGIPLNISTQARVYSGIFWLLVGIGSLYLIKKTRT